MESGTQLELPTVTQIEGSAFSLQSFEHAQRVAKMLASSSLIPKEYQGRIDNCMVALEMANRNGASPLMVMQNLHIIQGRPSWSSPFIIASLNSCGRFTKLNWRISGSGDTYGFEAYATNKATGEELVSPKVDWKMVKEEGWLSKPGSKWKTMPELMFRYRSAAFFGRLHAPDILMGMQTTEEVVDVIHEPVQQQQLPSKEEKQIERMKLLINSANTTADLDRIFDKVPEELLDLFTVKKDELKGK